MTTAGGIEEDFIKCLAHTYLGDFNLPGKELRLKGINRLVMADVSRLNLSAFSRLCESRQVRMKSTCGLQFNQTLTDYQSTTAKDRKTMILC